MSSPSSMMSKFVVRLPGNMREEVAAMASEKHLSMNSLIVQAVSEKLARECRSEVAVSVLMSAADISPGAADVLAERSRQINVLGYTSDSDDAYNSTRLIEAAACYLLYGYKYPDAGSPPPEWPFPPQFWKPKSMREDWVRAGALVIAEIDRFDRFDARFKEGEEA